MAMMISVQNPGTKKCRHNESGYTLLMVVFMVATSLIFASAVLPNLLTQGRREREQEAIWRGEQYERAIGLYYRKFGRYPTKIEDLTQQTNGVRFLRKAYTDPMNKDDGSWRFIYVGPNGQLIGSVHSQSLLQSALSASGVPGLTLPGAGAQPPPPGSATGTTNPGQTTPGQTATGQTGAGQSTGSAATPDSLQSQPQPLSGNVIGGNIIGIGSKVKEDSLLVYKGGASYDEWEFIWNPQQQIGPPGQAAPVNPAVPGNPAGPGQQQPTFSIPSFTTPGTPTPGTTAPTTPPPGI
jgi:type II secretory pathway pseudopilin PulG